MMDITDTLAPNSDQLDAVDVASTGPRIFTVKSVSKGDAEQPVQVHLVEFPRGPWRPGKNMRRVLAACWGADASAWVGRHVELYCDPAVMFGKEAVGGIRIKRLSDIDGQQKIPLIVSRGKSAVYTVQPLEASTTTGGGGVSAVGAPESEAPAPEESALRQAVEVQMAAFDAAEKARLIKLCARLKIKASRDGIINAWGEGARDIKGMCDSIEARLAEEATA